MTRWKSPRTQFEKERNRRLENSRSGSSGRSRKGHEGFALNEVMLFFLDYMRHKPTIGNVSLHQETPIATNDYSQQTSSVGTTADTIPKPKFTVAQPVMIEIQQSSIESDDSPANEFTTTDLEAVAIESELNTSTSVSSASAVSQHRKRKKPCRNDFQDTITDMLRDNARMIDDICAQTTKSKENEFDGFGTLVAESLRSMPKQRAYEVMAFIMDHLRKTVSQLEQKQ